MKMKKGMRVSLLAISIVLVAAVACGSGAGVVSPAGGASADPKAALDSSLKKQLGLNSYSGTLVGEFQGKSTTSLIEYLAPDRYHMKNSVVEAILIGKTTYVSLAGKWMKLNMDMTSLINSFRNPALLEAGISNAAYIGTDQVNGAAADVYSYTSTANFNGSKLSANVKVWITRQDNLPAKMEVTGQVGGVNTLSTIKYDYSSKVTIEPPMQ
jgi:hypothetical protein